MAPASRVAIQRPKKRAVKPAIKKAVKPAAKKAAKPAAKVKSKPSVKAVSKPAVPTRRPAGSSALPAATPPTQASRPGAPVAAVPDLYSSLHALLHTMRLIERHDEPLCSMHDELKRTGRLSPAQRRRLQQLVNELPAEDYQADLETLRQAAAA